MPYCSECGVELAAEAAFCPLCGRLMPAAPPDKAAAADPPKPRLSADLAPDLSAYGLFQKKNGSASFTPRERRKIAWEVLSVAAAIAALALCAINLLESRTLNWAFYPLAALGFIWAIASALLLLDRRPVLMYPVAFLSLPAFLVAIDGAHGALGWSWQLGVPIAFLAEIIIAVEVIMIRRARRKGLNLIALVLFGLALFCLGVELCLSFFLFHRLSLVWSPICATALVPMALFLLYLHLRVLHSTNLRRMFRL